MMSLSVWLPGPMFLPAGGGVSIQGWGLSRGVSIRKTPLKGIAGGTHPT